MGVWSDEALAYDGNTGTFAYVAQNNNMWCQWCKFTYSIAITTPTKVRIWMSHEVGATPNQCHLKVYDGLGGSETPINTNIDHDQYVEANITTLTKISYLEVRFQGQTVVTKNIYVNEIGIYGDDPVTFSSNKGTYSARMTAQRGGL